MDTHIAPDAPVIDGTPLRCVRLPGEPDGEAGAEPARVEWHVSRKAQLGASAIEDAAVSETPRGAEQASPAPDVEAAATLKPPRAEERLSGDPGVESPIASGTLHADGQVPGSTALARKRKRHGLVTGVAVVVLVAVVGASAGVFVLSPYNHVVPVPSHVRAAVRTLELRVGELRPGDLRSAWAKPPLVAPAASLAGEKLPPQPAAVVQPAFHPLPAPAQLAQVLQLGPHPPGVHAGASSGPAQLVGHPAGRVASGPRPESPAMIAPPAPGAVSGAPPGYVAHEPGTVPVAAPGPSARMITDGPEPAGTAPTTPAQAVPGTPTVVASTSPLAALAPSQPPGAQPASSPPDHSPVATSAIPPPASGTRDAAVVAAQLRAAPLATAQQVQVLEVVNEIAAMVRDERTELADLQARMATLSRGTKTKLLNFERRLALLEAQTGIAAAAVVGRPPPMSPPAAAPPSAPPATAPAGASGAARAANAASTAPATSSPVARVRYRLQAASPGLALLAEIDKGGGAGAQLQVSVGDTIPGYGRVISVAQQGTSWVVTTEHGSIR